MRKLRVLTLKNREATLSIIAFSAIFLLVGSAESAQYAGDKNIKSGKQSVQLASIKAGSGRSSRSDMDFAKTTHFPSPPGVTERAKFWKKIYSKYTTGQIVIHDKDNMNLIFDVVDVGKKYRYGSRAERKYVRKRKEQIKAALMKLYHKKGIATTRQEKKFAAMMRHIKGYKKYKKSAHNLRGQHGQANRFKEGLVRSGKYLGQMRGIFRSFGLPDELTALPHVESSFNYKAYSSAGAAGIWQFTRSTGRMFMKINSTIDERRDPIMATYAAAKLLKQNYEKLGSWPLALTAYNHGAAGMSRAKRKHGNDIDKIIKRYRSRSFGFASKNFYAEFLAALEVARNHKLYFGDVKFLPEQSFNEVTLAQYVPAKTVANKLGLSINTLKTYNRALKNGVWKGYRHIPRGYSLRVPSGYGDKAVSALATLKPGQTFSSQKHNGYHIVRRGDTLSTIAKRYRSSVRSFKRYNGIRSSIIRVGQRLKIPGSAGRNGSYSRSAASTSSSSKDYYYVKRGDNLATIAKRHGVSLSDLLKRNNFTTRTKIYPKQKIVIRQRASAPKAASSRGSNNSHYTVKRGDNLATIARRHGVKLSDLLKHNNFSVRTKIYPKQKIMIRKSATSAPKPESRVARAVATGSGHYYVRSGDTLSGIAKKHSMSLSRLLRLNNFSSRTRIYPKQKIVVDESLQTSKPANAIAKTGATTDVGHYYVRRGDTLSTIASRHDVSLSELMSMNNFSSRTKIYPKQKIIVNASLQSTAAPSSVTSATLKPSSYYYVRKGDTLSSIAKKHGIPLVELLKLNNFTMRTKIYPKQKIVVQNKADSLVNIQDLKLRAIA